MLHSILDFISLILIHKNNTRLQTKTDSIFCFGKIKKTLQYLVLEFVLMRFNSQENILTNLIAFPIL